MKINPAMLELVLRSAGMSKQTVKNVLETMAVIDAQGLSAFAFKPMAADDPAWMTIGAGELNRGGMWLRAEGLECRVTVGVFVEGGSDEALEILSSLGSSAKPDGLALPACT